MKKFTKRDLLIFVGCIILASYAIWYNQKLIDDNPTYYHKNLTDDEIKSFTNRDLKAIVIYPIFTQIAYKDGGFYDYYKGKCASCTTVSMRPLGINETYNTGASGYQILSELHYPVVTDMLIDKHPEILNDYDKVILLHNEYVTQTEFDAITKHKNVLYMYPNSLYAKISVNYTDWTMTLVRGHGFPDTHIGNGFGFMTNTEHEYDTQCKNYKWMELPNGMQMTCWPEYLAKWDRSMLETIKDYPAKQPSLIPMNTTNINMTKFKFCDQFGNCS